jgi:hypothetical protein
VKRLWTGADIDATAAVLWTLLVDPEAWPKWGPTVQRAAVEGGPLRLGARGTVVATPGLTLPFEVVAWEPGARWAWKVAGVEATDHRVEALGPDRCRVSFGVPWPAAPYLAVCRMALRRLDGLARPGAPG